MRKNSMKKNTVIKIKKVLYSNRRIGKIKEKYYGRLADKYGFDRWHVTPVNFRPYALGIVSYLNEHMREEKGKVVEIGCGLGEIVGNINARNKTGYDIAPNVIRAAERLYPCTKFRTGSFEDIEKQNIEYLITVNFIHGTPPAELREKYKRLCRKNRVEHIVLDIVKDRKYEFNHDADFLFNGLGYKVQKRLPVYKTKHGCRWIYIMEKCNEKYVRYGENI